MDLYLGIDIGGSHISGWILDRNGKTYNTFPKRGVSLDLKADHLLNYLESFTVCAQSAALNQGGRLVAVGLASPGPLEPNAGIIISPPNLPGIRNLKIIKIMKERVELPFFLINDADAAVIGEAWLGSAQGFRNVIMLTLGTGVGSGIIADGRLQRGRGMGGEWGHTTIRSMFNYKDKRKCSCGRFNCLEAFCGTEGLAQTYCNVFGVRREDLSSEFVQEISRKMRKRGNFLWAKLFEAYCDDLAEGIINIINVHQPDCIILGGGIACDSMAGRVQRMLQNCGNQLDVLARGVDVRVAANLQSGLIGAAKHAIDCQEAEIEKYRAEHGVYS